MVKATVTLASGHEMPLVGFGLWKVPKEAAAETVYNVSRSNHVSLFNPPPIVLVSDKSIGHQSGIQAV